MVQEIKHNWFRRHWIISIILVILIIGIIGSAFDSSSNNASNTANSGIKATQEEAKTYSIGDSIQAGDFTWKITGSSTATEIGQDIGGSFFGEKADGIFIILDVEVTNTGNSAQYLMDSYLKLVDDQGREFSPNSAAAIYLKPEGSALMFEQVNPGITKKGKIVFDVPVDLKVANIRISSDLLSSSFYNIKLMI
jgi:hypothetical protein